MPKKPTRRNIEAEDLQGLRYASYIRDSTEEQADRYGPEMQRVVIRDYATRHGLIDAGLVFEEYVSGGNLRARREIRRAVDELRAGHYAVLLVGWTHRFSRDAGDAFSLQKEITAAGGILIFAGQGLISGQKGNRVTEGILYVLDQEYRDNLADLVAGGLKEKFKDGLANGLPPLGTRHLYRRSDGTMAEGPERNTIAYRALNERELPALEALLRRYAEEGSYRRTAAWLNDHGFRTHAGGLFTTASVKTVILNPFYGPEEIVRYHPGLSDQVDRPTPPEQRMFPAEIHELWERAQEKRTGRTAVRGPLSISHVYPLHAVLRCATCGGVYHGQWMKNARHSKHAGHGTECRRPFQFRSERIERQLAEALEGVSIPRDWRSQIRRILEAPRVDDTSEQRVRLERMLEKLRYQHLHELVDDVTFRDEARQLREQIEALKAQTPAPLESYREPVQIFRSIGKIIGHRAVEKRDDGLVLIRQFCETAFSRIDIEGTVLTTLHPRAQYRELFAVALASSEAFRGMEMCGREDFSAHPNIFGLETSAGLIKVAGIDSILERLEVAS